MKPLLVVDAPRRFPLKIPGTEIISAFDYLSDPSHAGGPGRKVFNLCRSLKYQSQGYYVSLLAEARGHRPLPSVAAIRDLKLGPVVRLVSEDLDQLMQANLRRIKSDTFELSVYFGHNLAPSHDPLALAVFNAFPSPLLRAKFDKSERWRLVSVRVLGLADVPEAHRPFLIEQATRYLRRTPSRRRGTPTLRYDLAILHDPAEAMPPSDPRALRNFIAAGEELGLRCQMVEKDAYGRIGEFDALFIRETTHVDHHTYRFARRATAEGMVVIDDPGSILRCGNKVFLAETLDRHRVPTPKTMILSEENAAEALRSLGFPCVVKLPDSAFSAGVSRVDSAAEAEAACAALFEQSDLLIAQEYVPTSFDWRVGVLGGKPLYVCRYGMAPNHWQIVKRDASGVEMGNFETLPVTTAPPEVVALAVKAANLMGDGLYGVDLKQVNGKACVIEVNDNPNLDAGVEDVVLGDELYHRVMRHFLQKLEAQ